MTVNHHCGDQAGMLQSSPAESHANRALEQAARFAADLAIARWSRAAGTAIPARAAWMARAHDGMRQWLDAGGFAQHDSGADETVQSLPGKQPRFYTLFRQARSTASWG